MTNFADTYAESLHALPPLEADPSSYLSGGGWVLDAPDHVPAVWGDSRSGQVLWAEGEPCMLCAPAGVGKTTLAGQIVFARLGLLGDNEVLGFPVRRTTSKVLYIAADRPRQIRRSLKRLARPEHRSALDERLVVRQGPPPRDFAKDTDTLLVMCQEAGADTVVIDSLKDVAVGISADDVGSGVNMSIQKAIAADVEVLVLHHQRKGQNGEKPKTLEDVYGSTWITAGMGSVVLLWGKAGDLLVELHHLKQPSHPVGPLKIEHDHEVGMSTIIEGPVDPLKMLEKRANGLTASELASLNTRGKATAAADEKKAKRSLQRLVDNGLAIVTPAVMGGPGGSQPARYHAAATVLKEAM